MTTCDHITSETRRAFLSDIELAFVESEAALHQQVSQGASLVVLHVSGVREEGSAAGRLMRAVPKHRASVVALSGAKRGIYDAALRSECHDDVILVRDERWLTLLRAWVKQPSRARQRVAELRLLHSVAPPPLLDVLDLLMFLPESSLCVKKWSAAAGCNRMQLYRDIALTGMTPSGLLDMVRTVHAVGRCLVERTTEGGSGSEFLSVRTERRILLRTLAVTQAEIVAAGPPGSLAVRKLVTERLQRHLECAYPCPSRAVPATLSSRTGKCVCPRAGGPR